MAGRKFVSGTGIGGLTGTQEKLDFFGKNNIVSVILNRYIKELFLMPECRKEM
jgi:hypothetical protein